MTSCVRTTRVLAGIVVGVLFAAPGVGATPLAGPAEPEQAAACQVQRTVQARTAEVAKPVSDRIVIGGCVTDNTGIEHIVADWHAETRDEQGRICTDPQVVQGMWGCLWDTTLLEPGTYWVEFAAIDLAGNRGTFRQRFEVRPPETGTELGQQSTVPPALQPAPAPPSGEGPADQTAEPSVPATELERQLAIARVRDCVFNEVEDAPTASADVVTLPNQAEAVRACIEPALEVFGASVLKVDAIPEPPAVRAIIEDPALRDALAAALPETVAGVPLLLLIPEDLPEYSGVG